MAMAVAAAPSVNVYRPHTSPIQAEVRPSVRKVAQKERGRASRDGYANRELNAVMENDYEWPDLPPIESIKDAISRQRVSQGVSYILPVDKTKCSVENVYRTNLRVMFQDPYAAEKPGEYDETQVRTSTRHHFLPNSVPTAYKRNVHADPRNYQINAESEKVRKGYSKSAPSTGLAARRSLTNSELRQRSNLYLPLKVKLPEEAKKLKEEASRIINSVQEREEEYDPSKDNVVIPPPQRSSQDPVMRRPMVRVRPGRMGAGRGRARFASRASSNLDSEGNSSVQKKTDMFESYEDLKSTPVPKVKSMPEYIQDLQFLTEDKKSDIWTWLNKGDEQTDFSYFLEICS